MAAVAVEPVVGKDCKLYYDSASNYAVPVWVLIPKAINVAANLGKGEADVSARYAGWKLSKGALKELEVTFTYRHIKGADTVFDALLDSYINDTPIQLLVLDDLVANTGAQGARAFCEIMQMNEGQELESSQEFDFMAKPTYFEEAAAIIVPEWHEVV